MKYFCLNMDRATDRREYAASEFARAGIDVMFVRAFDILLNNIRHLDEDFRRGNLGCYLSHMRLIEEIGRYDYGPAVIMEDDVHLADDFPVLLQDAISALPADWDVAFIGWWPVHNDYGAITTAVVDELWMQVTAGGIWGMYGYVVNGRKGADKLLQVLQPIVRHTDEAVYAAVVSGGVNGYFLREPLVTHPGYFQSQTLGLA